MPLTADERNFLAVFIHEATTDPFKGPATEELHRRNIFYTDLSHLLASYYREAHADQEGFGGKYTPILPACPWLDRESALRRDEEIETELENASEPTV
jgi:hypothetical protein